MARFFITGSSDGLGLLTAQRLVAGGHQVVLHARSDERAQQTKAACPEATAVLVADLTSLDETRQLAAAADALGPYDAVVHNAGLYVGWERVPGKSGLPSLFAVNVVAPYMLAVLMRPPKRLVFISSNMHVDSLPPWDQLPGSSYSESKLEIVLLAFALARRWPDVQSNALDPGWVATKMGGKNAPDDMNKTVALYETLTLGTGEAEGQTGKYFAARAKDKASATSFDVSIQERLLEELEKISGVSLHG